jgi:hypothetical protein
MNQDPQEFLDITIAEDGERLFAADEFQDIGCAIVYHKSWDIIDATKLSDARRCLRRFFLAHILGWKESLESNHLVFGRAWHAAMEYLRLHGLNPESLEGAYQAFMKIYRETYSTETDGDFGAKNPGNACLALGEYAARYQNVTSERTLYTEIADSVPIAPDRMMAFKMDAIMQNELGLIFPVDDKTGSEVSKRWTDQWAMAGQLTGYCHVLRMIWPVEKLAPGYVNGAIFRKKGNDFLRVPIHRSDEQLDAWLWQANWYWDQIAFSLEDIIGGAPGCKSEDSYLRAFPWNEEGCSKYTGCEYHDICSNIPNPLLYYNKDSYLSGKPEAPPGYRVEFWNPFEEFTTASKLSAFGLKLRELKSDEGSQA